MEFSGVTRGWLAKMICLVVLLVVLAVIAFTVPMPRVGAQSDQLKADTKAEITEQAALNVRSQMLLDQIASPSYDFNQTMPTRARAIKELLYIQLYLGQ